MFYSGKPLLQHVSSVAPEWFQAFHVFPGVNVFQEFNEPMIWRSSLEMLAPPSTEPGR
jgi:hypothetical protein